MSNVIYFLTCNGFKKPNFLPIYAKALFIYSDLASRVP